VSLVPPCPTTVDPQSMLVCPIPFHYIIMHSSLSAIHLGHYRVYSLLVQDPVEVWRICTDEGVWLMCLHCLHSMPVNKDTITLTNILYFVIPDLDRNYKVCFHRPYLYMCTNFFNGLRTSNLQTSVSKYFATLSIPLSIFHSISGSHSPATESEPTPSPSVRPEMGL